MQFSKDFENIYIKYSDKIYKYLYLNTRDPYLSEDITAEVFLRIWKAWKRIKPDFLQALLYKTAKNILIDYYRKNANSKKISLEEIVGKSLEPSYDENMIDKIHKDTNLEKITEALHLLPENLREVIVLRFVNDLSSKEAAVVLDTTEVNIRVLQFRGLKKLREVLKDE